VAYWSAQSASVFERADIRDAVDSFVSIETVLGHGVDDEEAISDQGVDRLLAAYAARELPKLKKPFLVVLHFAGTHIPYFVDPARAPFAPWTHDVSWSGMTALHNAYKNAILEQDRSVATSLRAFFGAAGGAPHAVLFTSDHGESFGEHGAIHHGQNLYDEQIHVPAWIVARKGAISEDDSSRLAAHRDAWLTHVDLLPTILDLYGVWNGYALAPLRRTLSGRSLLGETSPMARPLPVTNCTEMFPCPLNTWGMLFEDRALLSQSWDSGWWCVDLAGRKAIEPSDPSCARMREASKGVFPELPNRRPNL
jgi:membrane-anchored protein YejM (alkaline phosphatase superfamily)